MRKLFTIALFLMLLIVTSIVGTVRFTPSIYIDVFNKFSDEQLSIKTLNVSFLLLTVDVKQLRYSNIKNETIAKVKSASVLIEPIAWLRTKNNFWKLKLDNVDLKLHRLPKAATKKSDRAVNNSRTFNIHQLISRLNTTAQAITVELDKQSTVRINHFNTKLNNAALVDYNKVEQTIDFSVDYIATPIKAPLTVEGVVQSRIIDGVSAVKVSLSTLDLNPLLNDSEPKDGEPKITADEYIEREVNWGWLSRIDAINLDLNITELFWKKSSVTDINLAVAIDDAIDFRLQSHVLWSDSEKAVFNEKVTISGAWEAVSPITLGADLRGNIDVSTSGVSMTFNGDINVNGSSNNLGTLNISSKELPGNIGLDTNTLALLEQYMPLDVSIGIEQFADSLKLDVIDAKFGKSDLKGSIEIDHERASLLTINSNLHSTQLVISTSRTPSVPNDTAPRKLEPIPTVLEGEATAASESKISSKRLFSDNAIDWPWLESVDAKLIWQLEKVIIDNIEMTDVSVPITLNNGTLRSGIDAENLASGRFTFDSVFATQGEVAELSIDAEASGIILEQLGLLTAEELKKAVTNLRIDLNTKGRTSQELASALNGTIKMNVDDGTIDNNSFELIGSDLTLSLLKKLNPFSKSDKTTKLDCAVLNLNIENGKINVNKSVALKTSKLTIVADGYIDLTKEKIKLNITPKARSGIGIDASSLVKFVALGGTLMEPAPVVTALGIAKSAAIIGAAASTGGMSLLATSATEKTLMNVDVCERADNAFN